MFRFLVNRVTLPGGYYCGRFYVYVCTRVSRVAVTWPYISDCPAKFHASPNPFPALATSTQYSQKIMPSFTCTTALAIAGNCSVFSPLICGDIVPSTAEPILIFACVVAQKKNTCQAVTCQIPFGKCSSLPLTNANPVVSLITPPIGKSCHEPATDEPPDTFVP